MTFFTQIRSALLCVLLTLCQCAVFEKGMRPREVDKAIKVSDSFIHFTLCPTFDPPYDVVLVKNGDGIHLLYQPYIGKGGYKSWPKGKPVKFRIPTETWNEIWSLLDQPHFWHAPSQKAPTWLDPTSYSIRFSDGHKEKFLSRDVVHHDPTEKNFARVVDRLLQLKSLALKEPLE